MKKYVINGKEFNSDDSASILAEIKIIKQKEVGDRILEDLIVIFKHTYDFKLLDGIALLFADASNKEVIKVLVDKIVELKDSGHTSTLIYACSEYDCAEYILIFAELLLYFEDSNVDEVFAVMTEIKAPIQLSDKILIQSKFEKYFISNKDIGSRKRKYIKNTIELLDGMKVCE